MAKLPVFATVGLAFSDTVRATRAMPVLAAATAVVGVGYFLFASFAPSDSEPGGLLSSLGFGLASAIFFAPVLIAVYRFIIVNEATLRYVLDVRNARFQAFCGWSIAFFLVAGFPASIVFAYVDGDLGTILGTAGAIAGFPIIAAFALVLPAVAVDAPNVTLRNAIADIRGSFWRVAAILTLTYLSLVALAGIACLVLAVVAYWAFEYETSERSTGAILSLASLCGEPVWAAATARVFLVVADRLRSPKQG